MWPVLPVLLGVPCGTEVLTVGMMVYASAFISSKSPERQKVAEQAVHRRGRSRAHLLRTGFQYSAERDSVCNDLLIRELTVYFRVLYVPMRLIELKLEKKEKKPYKFTKIS